jgi:hypothetical protein
MGRQNTLLLISLVLVFTSKAIAALLKFVPSAELPQLQLTVAADSAERPELLPFASAIPLQ